MTDPVPHKSRVPHWSCWLLLTAALAADTALNLVSYPVGGGCWVVGVSLPWMAFEPSADKESLLPFSSPISPLIFLVDLTICMAVAIALKRYVLCHLKGVFDRR